MISEYFNVVQRERLDVQEVGTPFGKRNNRPLQLLTASLEFDSVHPTAVVEPETKTGLQRSDDLDAASGMLVGIGIGTILWGLVGGAVNLLFS